MPARGEVATLEATFYDAGELIDPPSIDLTITRNGVTVATYDYPGTITKLATGLFGVTWLVPVDAALGTYVAEWSAVLVGGDPASVGYEAFTVTDTPLVVVTGSAYCTLAEARAAGAVGDDTAVDKAVREAMARVDRFTGDRFSPRVMTVVARVGGDGRAMLPYRLTSRGSVTEVRDTLSDAVLAGSTWRAYSSSVDGEADAIGLGRRHVGSNILILGLEPWAAGDPNWDKVEVTATFGWANTPASVEWATAKIAAAVSRQFVDPDPDDNPATPAPTTQAIADPEGNVLPVVPPFTSEDGTDVEPDVAQARTTGVRQADALLIPYRRNTILMASV
jgi:hypothetical protein